MLASNGFLHLRQNMLASHPLCSRSLPENAARPPPWLDNHDGVGTLFNPTQ